MYARPGCLARHNKAFGRVISSRIDLDVYCPEEVIQQSGPLFGDEEHIQQVVDAFISSKLCDFKAQAKCLCCGFPNCECTVCHELVRVKGTTLKTSATSKHTCALRHVGCGRPSKKGPYDLELNSHLAQAWAEQAVLSPPVYKSDVAIRGFYFPEELE